MQASFARTGSQARVRKNSASSSQVRGSKNGFPCTVARLPSKVLGNRFPSKVSTNRSPKQGSQGQVCKQASQEQVHKQGFARTAPQVPKQGFQEQVSLHGSKATKRGPWEQVPKQGFHEQVPKQGSQGQVCKQALQEQVHKQGFARTAPQVPKQGFQEQVSLHGSKATKQGPWEQVPKQGVGVPRTHSLGRFRGIGCQHGSHEHVPKHGFRLLMFPGTAFQEPLAKRNSEEHLQARLETRTGSQARFRRTGSKTKFPSKVPKNRFPSKVPMNRFEASRQSFQEQVPKREFPGYHAMLPRAGS